MITYSYDLDMSPGGVPIPVHVNQYDDDFSLVFSLFSSRGTFTLTSGTVAKVRGTKRDGNGYSADCTIDTTNKTVTVAGHKQMTAVAGNNTFELVLSRNNKVLSTANFILCVERSAMDAGTIVSDSVLQELNAIIAGAETATGAAYAANAAASRAEAAAQSLEIDATLTQVGQVADAKATGDGIADLKNIIDQIEPGLSEAAKQALLACFAHVAWVDEYGQSYYDDLEDALNAGSGSHIGTLIFRLGLASSLRNCGGYWDIANERYGPQPVDASRVSGDMSPIVFKAGDLVTVDDFETYSLAIGTNSTSWPSGTWIGGGYLQSYPYELQENDVESMKVVFLKRNDGQDISRSDISYLNNHITVTRVVNKDLFALSVSYDGTTIEAEKNYLVAARPHLSVTAAYSDNTFEEVTLYTLSGELRTGSNTVSVRYGNKTVPVIVNAVEIEKPLFNNYDFLQVSSAQWGRYSDETPEENSGLIPSSTADNTKVWIDFSNVSLNVGDIVYTTGGYWKFALGTNNANTSYSGSNWIEGGFMPDHYHVMTAEDVLDAKILYFKRTDNEEITPSQFKDIRNNFSIRRA